MVLLILGYHIKPKTKLCMVMKNKIEEIVQLLRVATQYMQPPLINAIITEYGHDAFLILIGCLLSLRSKDSTTIHVCRKLFDLAKTPEQLLKVPLPKLEKIIFKTVFYKNKAKTLHHVCHELLDRFDGKVPETFEELTSMNGVGLKTANLVLGMAFDKPAICVDTHVHRISNRLGLIKTKTAEETEAELKKILQIAAKKPGLVGAGEQKK